MTSIKNRQNITRIYHSIRRRAPLRPNTINEHLEPWRIPVARRINMLKKALKAQRRVAIMLFHTPDATFRYRCYNVFRATIKSKRWFSIYFLRDELDIVEEYLEKASIFIIARMEYEPEIEHLINVAHKCHIPVVYDIDDRICHADYLNIALKTISPPATDRKAIKDFALKYQKLAEMTDGFITTNDLLGRELKKTFHKPYQVIPNSLNSEQIAISKYYFRRKKFNSNGLRIGYFSGTASHDNDFAVVATELLNFMQNNKNVSLRIVGKLNLPKKFDELKKNGRLEFFPVTDYLHLQKQIAEVDINIAPLASNIFTDCKSELKFFEAAAVGTPTIASPSYVFRKAIQNTYTGFLCRPGEWYDSFDKLLDEKMRRTMGRRARTYALTHYSPDAILVQIEKTYDYYTAGNKK